MIADMALLHADDIAAILGALDPGERLAVEGLLREHAAHFEPPQPPAPDPFDPVRLSPWLLERLHARDDAMTQDARLALRDVAVRLYPAAQGKPAPSIRIRP